MVLVLNVAPSLVLNVAPSLVLNVAPVLVLNVVTNPIGSQQQTLWGGSDRPYRVAVTV